MTKLVSNSKIEPYATKSLSVQVSLNGLSFFIHNTHKELLYETHKPFESAKNPSEVLSDIKTTFQNNEILNEPVQELTVSYYNTLYCLVPTPLFDETKATTYLNYNTKIYSSDYVAFDTLENSDVTVVYVPLININNYFLEIYDSFSYYHHISLFITNALTKERSGASPKMHVYFHNNHIDILVTQGKKIKLCNSFIVQTPQDAIYYILFVAEQLELNPEIFELEVSGKIAETDLNYQIIYQYVRYVTLGTKTIAANLCHLKI